MDQLKRQRSTAKSSITRIFNYCNGPDATNEGIRVRNVKIDDYFNAFEKIQDEIESEELTEEQAIIECQFRKQVEDTYYAVKTLNNRIQVSPNNDTTVIDTNDQCDQQITNVLDTLTRNQSILGTLVERLSTNTSTPIPQTVDVLNQHSSIKLPRINLPTFDGSYMNWIHFRDLFEALVHNRTGISNIEKFEYLQSYLKGDALSIIKHLNHSNENYTIGWKMIKEKYDKFDLIRNDYMKILFDQPAMKGPVFTELKRLVNNINECINALTAMKEPTEKWESVLLFHLERKLDVESRALWNRTTVDKINFKNFRVFLEQRLHEFEICQGNKTFLPQPSYKQRTHNNVHATSINGCPLCKQTHELFRCSKFNNLNVNDRIQVLKNNRMCYNCLQYGHMVKDCKGSTCTICKRKHNTLIHKNTNTVYKENTNVASPIVNSIDINAISAEGNAKYTLLPTAMVMILGENGEYFSCRILLDTGAQTTLVSETCVQRLNLKRSYDKTVLCGVGGENKSYARGKVQLLIKSYINEKSIKTTALCLQKLTQLQPTYQVSNNELEFFKNLQLADRQCNIPNRIDVILGADVFNEWSLNQQIIHPSGSPSALSTIFGWVIIGNVTVQQIQHVTIAHTSIDVSKELQQFWKIEELQDNKTYWTDEEQQAENHYKQNVQRDKTGRYIVRYPFKNPNPDFGNTKTQSLKRLFNMESRFANNSKLHEDYTKFIDEYIKLNHMECINNSRLEQYFLPHHAVIKAHSTTTKLRVVFDGSAKGTNGMSLNEELLIGPTIQNDIFTILLQFRKYQVGLSADIEKMYRQILMHSNDRAYQCIVWRANNSQDVATYQLNTITYGTSAAPFLAIRTLKQIAIDNQEKNTTISDIIINNFYVDDFMYSVPDASTAIQVKIDLCNILSEAGLNLRKWSSNSDEVLQTINKDDQEISATMVIDDDKTVKTLGLYWNTASDMFKYSVSIPKIDKDVTKIQLNRLTQWQQLQQLVQMFWKRWSNEYLTQLQGRHKWKQKWTNLKINDVVIVKDENCPPCKWLMGKIIETHPGTDGLVRVVTIKTQKGVYKRPVLKLCPLIVDS